MNNVVDILFWKKPVATWKIQDGGFFQDGRNLNILKSRLQQSSLPIQPSFSRNKPAVWFTWSLEKVRGGLTGRQEMLTPPRHMIPFLVYPEVCICPIIWFVFPTGLKRSMPFHGTNISIFFTSNNRQPRGWETQCRWHISICTHIHLPQWLIDYLQFYVPLKNSSLIWRRHYCRRRAAKFWPMLGAQGLWAGRDLYHATPTVIRDLGFCGLIRRTAPFSRLLRHTRGCGGSILTRILTGACLNDSYSLGFYRP
jgi:hypothetical protein